MSITFTYLYKYIILHNNINPAYLWFFILSALPKILPQMSHGWSPFSVFSFSSLCILSCISRLYCFVNVRWQTRHSCASGFAAATRHFLRTKARASVSMGYTANIVSRISYGDKTNLIVDLLGSWIIRFNENISDIDKYFHIYVYESHIMGISRELYLSWCIYLKTSPGVISECLIKASNGCSNFLKMIRAT